MLKRRSQRPAARLYIGHARQRMVLRIKAALRLWGIRFWRWRRGIRLSHAPERRRAGHFGTAHTAPGRKAAQATHGWGNQDITTLLRMPRLLTNRSET